MCVEPEDDHSIICGIVCAGEDQGVAFLAESEVGGAERHQGHNKVVTQARRLADTFRKHDDLLLRCWWGTLRRAGHWPAALPEHDCCKRIRRQGGESYAGWRKIGRNIS